MRAPVSTLILGNRSPIWVIGALRPIHIGETATQIWIFTGEIVSAADEIVSVTDRKGKIMSEIQEIAQHIQDFPALVRKSRMDKGITNEELAELSGISYSAVCKMQSGERDHYKRWSVFSSIFAAILSLFLIVYLFFDFRNPNAGFVLQDGPTAFAWLVILLTPVSIVVCSLVGYRALRDAEKNIIEQK